MTSTENSNLHCNNLCRIISPIWWHSQILPHTNKKKKKKEQSEISFTSEIDQMLFPDFWLVLASLSHSAPESCCSDGLFKYSSNTFWHKSQRDPLWPTFQWISYVNFLLGITSILKKWISTRTILSSIYLWKNIDSNILYCFYYCF